MQSSIHLSICFSSSNLLSPCATLFKQCSLEHPFEVIKHHVISHDLQIRICFLHKANTQGDFFSPQGFLLLLLSLAKSITSIGCLWYCNASHSKCQFCNSLFISPNNFATLNSPLPPFKLEMCRPVSCL